MIKIIQKKIDQKPKRWHSVLNEALWAYRMAPHGATKTSPYELLYGHRAVLPWEMQSDSRRVVLQKDLSSKDYSGLMMDELEDLHMIRLRALDNIEKNKMRVAKYYNKKVKVNQFAEGDLVWKALLPIGTKYSTFGKWSPNWEGPFWVVRCTPGNAYILKTLLGIQKKIDQKPKRWHSVLNESLWAYRMAPHGATKTSPYELVYEHRAVLPWEMQSDSRRVVLQKDLSSKDYSGLMMDELEDLHMIRLRALENIEKNKMQVPNSS
jgi:hypothetical protein